MYLCTQITDCSLLPMGEKIKKLKKIRIHREGTHELTWSALAIAIIGYVLWHYISSTIFFWIFIVRYSLSFLDLPG